MVGLVSLREAGSSHWWVSTSMSTFAMMTGKGPPTSSGMHVVIRSPKTALKRAQDIMMMIKYYEGEGLNWWPLTERIVLKYVGGSERKSKSKLTGKNLVHAFEVLQVCHGSKL